MTSFSPTIHLEMKRLELRSREDESENTYGWDIGRSSYDTQKKFRAIIGVSEGYAYTQMMVLRAQKVVTGPRGANDDPRVSPRLEI